jgi:hypothetical protein
VDDRYRPAPPCSRQPLSYFYLAAFPVPDSPTVHGASVTLSKIFRLPLCGVVSVGLKVTDALQLLPGLRVFSHIDFTPNTDGDALSSMMLTAKPVFLLPAFLIVTVLALLVIPTVVLLPNTSEPGVIVSFSEIGAGVAVGVGVAVRVLVVAVAVGVAVAVRVAVAVAVAVGVGCGEPVKALANAAMSTLPHPVTWS